MLREFLNAGGGAVVRQVRARGIHPQQVLAQPDRLRPVHLRRPHHHLDVQTGALLQGPPRHCHDLHAQPGVLAPQPRHGRCRDVRAETVGRGHAYDAGNRVGCAVARSQRAHRSFHPLGHPHGFGAQLRQLPAAGRTRQDPAAQRLLQRRYPARNGGVVESQGLCRRRKFP